MSDVLIHTGHSLLGIYLAARYLSSAENRVIVMLPPGCADNEFRQSVSSALLEIGSFKNDRELLHRLSSCLRTFNSVAGPSQLDGMRINEVWYCQPADARETAWSAFSASVSRLEFDQFNYVSPACRQCGNDAADDSLHTSDETICRQYLERERKEPLNNWRVFRPSLIIGCLDPLPKHARGDLLQFLATLQAFKSEIEERWPEYFEYQSLRCSIPGDTRLNVISATDAADAMIGIAGQNRSSSSCSRISSASDITFAEFCEWVSAAYDMSLLPAGHGEELNAVDSAFDQRLAGFYDYLVPAHGSGPAAPYAAAQKIFDRDQAEKLLTSIRTIGEHDRLETCRRVSDLEHNLQRVSLEVDDFDLTYLTGGTGEPLVLLNALGQRSDYWYRLIDKLLAEYRVFIWDPRGVTTPPYGCGLETQISDLYAILQHEQIKTCHLLAWCTGAKVAVDFALQHPPCVASLTLLNSTFKSFAAPDLPQSDFEHNLESLCLAVSKRPELAHSVMKSLSFRGPARELHNLESKELGEAVLAQMNKDLQAHVMAPFQSEMTTLNYAGQLVEFWSHDVLSKAPLVQAPVLLISSEYDQIASPEASARAARLFPQATHIRVPGATHYCLYDRPDFIAESIHSFCRGACGFDSAAVLAEKA